MQNIVQNFLDVCVLLCNKILCLINSYLNLDDMYIETSIILLMPNDHYRSLLNHPIVFKLVTKLVNRAILRYFKTTCLVAKLHLL